jgi:hypothetical protein
VGRLKNIYKIFNEKKTSLTHSSRLYSHVPTYNYSTAALSIHNTYLTYLPQSSSLHSSHPSFEPARDTIQIATVDFQDRLATSGIEPGSPAWEYSTLPSELTDARKNTSIFSKSVVNVRVHFKLLFHLSSYIIKI